MKKAFGKGVDRDSLPSTDQLVSELINGLHLWRRWRERQRALPSLHLRATQHCLHTALPSCFDFLNDSARLAPLTHQRHQLSGLIQASRYQESNPRMYGRIRVRSVSRLSDAPTALFLKL